MKKLILIIVFIFGLGFLNFSQVIGFEGKRLSVELTTGISLSNKAFVLLRKLGDGDDDYKKFTKYPFLPSMRPNLEMNYTITNKSSIGIILSGSINKFTPITLNNKEVYANGVSYFGAGIRYSVFKKDFISPVGSTWSIYAKMNSVKSKEYKYHHVAMDNNTGNWIYPEKISEFKLKFYNIGMSWNSMTFLSDKEPLYLKYGLSLGLPFMFKYSLDDNEFIPEVEHSGTANLLYYYYGWYEIFEFNVGVGYIF